MTASNKQIAGSHYQSSMQCWDFILANDLGYLEGTAIKYLTRFRKKNGVEDLKKAKHFIEKLIEIEEAKLPSLDNVTRKWVEANWELEAMDNNDDNS